MVWITGQKLYGDRYRIERQLGKGGCGITYLARDRYQNPIVIKTLNDDVLNRPEFATYQEKFKRDFEKEALRLAVCQHPHIVRIENAFNEGDLPCMAMEYIQGEDLGCYVSKRGVLSETEALLYIRQIGEALTFVHEKGLLHRDVKPHNIMVRSNNLEAVLIDFGIAREFIPNAILKHTEHRTDGYAPPEQYAPEAQRGEYTDVYALAATLYYLLTQKVPTPVPARAIKIPLEPPQRYNTNISDRVNQAILKGMVLEPEGRSQTVADWLQLLSSYDSLPETIPSLPPFPLLSSVGINYNKLYSQLAAESWKNADEETEKIILKITHREKEGWLREEDVSQFPLEDLATINQLWYHYSQGKFGFLVQKEIWEEVGGEAVFDYQVEKRFCNRVGWDIGSDSKTFPSGYFPHLPRLGFTIKQRRQLIGGCWYFLFR